MECSMRLRKISLKTKTSNFSAINSKHAKKRRKIHGKRCGKCVCQPLESSGIEIPNIWEELRLNNQLCDGTVKCDDGVEFKIHRALLSAVSPYFKALFTNSLGRGQPETTVANVSFSSAIFSLLLNYAYTGLCVINEQNVEELLKAADQYEMMGVVQICCKFLMDEMCATNCIGILQFAGRYFCNYLKERGNLYVRHNFEAVLKLSKEFVLLDVQDLQDILKDDQLNIKTEDVAFRAIKTWVENSPQKRSLYLMDLLKCIRFGSMQYDWFDMVLKTCLIKKNKECKKFVKDTLNYVKTKLGEDTPKLNDYIFRPRIPYDVLFSMGGWSSGSPTNFVETYDIRADRWLLSADADIVPRAYHGLCTLNKKIYMLGGFDGEQYFNTVRCFDPATHIWTECGCMYFQRCYVSVVVHQSAIYALGGYNGRVRLATAEKFHPSKNQWELIPSMLRQRSDASAAVLNNKIYIVGGFNGQEITSSAEVFDILTNQWSYIPSMTSARSGVSLIAFRNTLYALGGFNGHTRLHTGEKYCPDSSGAWTDITDMMTPRSNFATAILDDFIYVLGGFNGSTTINYVEYYDTVTNEWFEAANMNLNRSALSAVVVSGLPNSHEYSVIGRNRKEEGDGTEKDDEKMNE